MEFDLQYDAFPEMFESIDQRESSINGHQDSNLAETPKTGLDCRQKIQQVPPATLVMPEVEKPSMYPGTSYETSCQCVLLALNLLEKLQTEDHQSNSDTVDHILELSKHALTQCLELSACQACMNTSRFTMLVINLCRMIVASWEKAVSTLGTEQQKFDKRNATWTDEEGQHDDVTGVITSPEGLQARNPNVYLKTYKIDDSEQLYVFTTLVRLQLSKWKAFLATVKSVLSRLELETQSSMLQDLDRRISTQHNICTGLLLDVEV